MSAITLQIAQAHLNAWLEAEMALTTGQEYMLDISGTRRRLIRADLPEVLKAVKYWSTMVNRLTRGSGGIPGRLAVPVDN